LNPRSLQPPYWVTGTPTSCSLGQSTWFSASARRHFCRSLFQPKTSNVFLSGLPRQSAKSCGRMAFRKRRSKQKPSKCNRAIWQLRPAAKCLVASMTSCTTSSFSTKNIPDSRCLSKQCALPKCPVQPLSSPSRSKLQMLYSLHKRLCAQQAARPNPSVKGTSTSGLRPLAAAPYLER
jgi:hypothetical protein